MTLNQLIQKTMDRTELVNKAKELLACGALSEEACDAIKADFPELSESEDERIRKEMINLIEWAKANKTPSSYYVEKYDSWIAYLEKHKEQKPAESDSIKGGDFISDGKRVFLVLANVEERNFGEAGSSYCESLILGVDGVVYCDGDDFKKYNRANSDERAKFIHNLKCGVIKEQKPAEWSEEDEEMRQRVIDTLKTVLSIRDEDDPIFAGSKMIRWIKNLHPQYKLIGEDRIRSVLPPHWKPSEEQIAALNCVLELNNPDEPIYRDILTLRNDFKKL